MHGSYSSDKSKAQNKSTVDPDTHDFSAAGSEPLPHTPNLIGQHYFYNGGPESTNCMVVGSSSGQKDPGKSTLRKSYGFDEICLNSNTSARGTSFVGAFNDPSTDKNGFSLTRISEEHEESAMNDGSNSNNNNISFRMDSWDSSASNIAFTIDHPDKRGGGGGGDTEFFTLDTQTQQYGVPHTSLGIAGMENFMNIPEDSVPCKTRAKRGCATHPRSIAERERRTRISGKLKKLQELVPNMDKQTSYADMLDLAVDHIKGLQKHVQELKKDMEKCTCDCKRNK